MVVVGKFRTNNNGLGAVQSLWQIWGSKVHASSAPLDHPSQSKIEKYSRPYVYCHVRHKLAGMTVSLPSREDFFEFSSEAFDKLSPIERAFVIQYVLGDDGIRGVGYKSYQVATAHPMSNDVAASCASQALKRPHVRDALRDIRRALHELIEDRMLSWAHLALKGQMYLDRVIETAINPDLPQERKVFANPNTLKAVEMAWDRAWGKPKQVQEHEIGEKLEDVLKQIAEKKKELLRAPQKQIENLPIRVIEPKEEK